MLYRMSYSRVRVGSARMVTLKRGSDADRHVVACDEGVVAGYCCDVAVAENFFARPSVRAIKLFSCKENCRPTAMTP
jgi:hypothetical protein